MTTTAYERIIAALESVGRQVKHKGQTVEAQCPAHDDRNPSLSVRQIEGQALVHCHAGCDVGQVLGALGLVKRDLYDNPRGSTYTYDDGRLVYRSPDKKFHQSNVPKGSKTTTLFRLGKVEAAVAAGEVVFLVEGEKDVLALESIGVTATTAPMGASSIDKCDLSPVAGTSVIAVVDKDEAGRAWASKVKDLVADVTFVEAAEGKDAADHIAAGHGIDDLVAITLEHIKDDQHDEESDTEKEPRKSAATMLVELARERYRFGVTTDGQPFGVRPGRHVVRMLRGGQGSLRAELSQDYYRLHEKAAPQQALADALLVLEGMAQQQDAEEVHIRVASGATGTVWVDLGDAAETAVRIDCSGWQTVDSGVPVLFRRTALTGVLPAPTDSDVDLLWNHLNVSAVDRPLILAWLVAALADPNNPHPILDLNGEQGTGKSTASRRIVSLVDPSPVPLRKPPRDQDSWVTAAQGSWVVGLDNLSAVPDWLSDSLCRASTGDGDVRRALYSDGGLAVFAFRRCVLVNGIDLGALRGDLADRLVLVQLERITESARVTESELAEQWDADYPSILGGLLTLCAGVIDRSPSLRLERSPRMADFAKVVAALDIMRGTDGLSRLGEQAKVLAEDSLSSDPLLQALDEQRPDFVGTAAQLLAALTPADDRWRAPKGWPKDPRAVTTVLKRNAPALRKAGWTVEQGKDRDKTVVWTIRPEIARIHHPPHPQHPQDGTGTAPERGSEHAQGAGVGAGVADRRRQHPHRHPQQHPQPRISPIPLIAPISTPGSGVAGDAGAISGRRGLAGDSRQTVRQTVGRQSEDSQKCVCGQPLWSPASKLTGVCAACSKGAAV